MPHRHSVHNKQIATNRFSGSSLDLLFLESVKECGQRQHEMIERLERTECAPRLLDGLSDCDGNDCGRDKCTEGCWLGTRRRRVANIVSGHELLSAHSGPVYAVCIVHPLWRAKVGNVADTSINAARQWIHRRLQKLNLVGLVAIGTFEESLNVELDGSSHWSGEVQLIVAGASKKELREAFKVEPRYRVKKHQKPMKVSEFHDLGYQLGYASKRLIEQRIAYISAKSGRVQRRHLPPKAAHWAEYDAWLLSLPLGARSIAFGCGRRGSTFIAR